MYRLIHIHRSALRNKRPFLKNLTAVIMVIHVFARFARFTLFWIWAALNVFCIVYSFFHFSSPSHAKPVSKQGYWTGQHHRRLSHVLCGGDSHTHGTHVRLYFNATKIGGGKKITAWKQQHHYNIITASFSLLHTSSSASEKNTGSWDEAVTVGRAETQHESFGSLKERDAMESEREQVMWRLQRLLGAQCDQGRVMEGSGRPSESVCTEDFVRCFRDEMVELRQADHDAQQCHHVSETGNGARFQSGEPCEDENPDEPKEHLSDSYRAKKSEEADSRGRLRVNDLESSKFCFSQIKIFFVFILLLLFLLIWRYKIK